MQTAKNATVFETFHSEDASLAAVVYRVGYAFHVQLENVASGEILSRRKFPQDLRESALSHARSLVWTDEVEDGSDDGIVSAVLESVASMFGPESVDATPEATPSTPTPTPSPIGVSESARKLTPAQTSSLEIIRLAIPSALNEVGLVRSPATVDADGLISTRDHRAQVLDALAKRGWIDPVAIGRNRLGYDSVRYLGPTGERAVRVTPDPGHPACGCWSVGLATPDGTPLGYVRGHECHRGCNVEVPAECLARIREILAENGWTLAD